MKSTMIQMDSQSKLSETNLGSIGEVLRDNGHQSFELRLSESRRQDDMHVIIRPLRCFPRDTPHAHRYESFQWRKDSVFIVLLLLLPRPEARLL